MTGQFSSGDERFERGSAFIRTGDGYVATHSAGGPWSRGHCHGGAVAGLLAYAAREVPSRSAMSLTRLSIDLFAPVPLGLPIIPKVRIDKDGVRTQRLSADLFVEGRILASGNLLRVRSSLPATASTHASPFDSSKAVRGSPGGFANAFDIIAERGGITVEGPGRVWFCLGSPLVEGEAVDMLAQAVAIADFSSAIGMNRDFHRFAFPSLDLTVGFARGPIGEWIRVDASNHDCDQGRAVCHGTLSDADGTFAHVIQTSFVEPRPSHLGQTA